MHVHGGSVAELLVVSSVMGIITHTGTCTCTLYMHHNTHVHVPVLVPSGGTDGLLVGTG